MRGPLHIKPLIYLIPAGLFGILLFATCSGRADDAAAYNDSIISHQSKIISAFDMMDATLSDTASSVEKLEYAHVFLKDQVHNSIMALDSIGPFRKDPSLQKAARMLFYEYENMAGFEYNNLLQISLKPPYSITTAVMDSVKTLQDQLKIRSKKAQEAFTEEQVRFGKKYHLVFE
jgi:hypothetical protein